MSFNQLDSKKQYLILAVMVLLLMGLYVKFRFLPATNAVGVLSKQLKTDQALLKNPNIPEEPLENIEDLKDNIAVLDVELEELTGQSANLAKKLPEINSQDVMLKISEVARSSRVRIVSNVPYLTRRRINFAGSASTDGSNKKLSIAEQRKRERAIRKSMQMAKKLAAQSGAGAAARTGVLTREGELMDKLVNDFEVSRPLHEIKIEGSYQNIKAFIEALQGLPWQITVVKINFSLLGQNTAQGYPQPLIVEMIIGA